MKCYVHTTQKQIIFIYKYNIMAQVHVQVNFKCGFWGVYEEFYFLKPILFEGKTYDF